MSSSEKRRWPWSEAYIVAKEICGKLKPSVHRMIVAGSFRRQKETVGDIEILFIPLVRERVLPRPPQEQLSLLEPLKPPQIERYPATDDAIVELEQLGLLARRKTADGRESYGPKNKLMVHPPSGVPVDLFTATEENWWNYVVCRTGSMESNVRIAQAAKDLGLRWNPYGSGFTRLSDGSKIIVRSEREVFETVKLPYLDPSQRT